jgi:hypothetical protein
MGYIKFALAAAFAAGTLMFPGSALGAAARAMAVWISAVAPALFPFAAVMPYLTSPQARNVYDRMFGWLVRRLLNLPGRCASAVVTGMFAGSPGGALATARVAAAEGLSPGQAARLAAVACGVGPIYIVSGIGVALMGSAEEGWRLAISQWAAQLIVGIVFSRCWKDGEQGKSEFHEPRDERPIQAAIMAVLRVCGYMVLFSVGLALFEKLTGLELWQISLIADLPSGVADAIASNGSRIAIAAGIGFGGVCIAAQNMSVLANVGVTWQRYILLKSAVAVLCAGVYAVQVESHAIGLVLPAGREFEIVLLLVILLMIPVTIAFFRHKSRVYTES